MPSFTINVKWGKEQFPDVELNTDEEPLLFKAQLFALTGVQPERQKVMFKGVTIKDMDWGNIKLRNGATILLMGSKDELPSVPVAKTKFVEDMNESELASALDLPAGLNNLGNSCYMNATVQCLKTVPELRESLEKYTGSLSLNNTMTMSQNITAALRDLYKAMDNGSSFPPIIMLQTLHLALPRFAEKTDNGGFAQQDANECWTELIRMLQQKLPSVENSKAKSLIDQYFGISFDVQMKCIESEDEPVANTTENMLQLSCFISTDVKYMQTGLKSKLQEQLSKFSSSLNRDAVYTKSSAISRLPAYLTVQFVRFYYKEKEAINAKILKDVKFPMEYDAYELCTPQLQAKLEPMRQKFKALEDAKTEEGLKMETNTEGESKVKEVVSLPYSFEDDPGSNNSGYYTLRAVLTHQGRSSSSGHYVAWIKHHGDSWLKCDDETVTPITSEDVEKLSGGGDWHCAYVLLYGPKVFQETVNKPQ